MPEEVEKVKAKLRSKKEASSDPFDKGLSTGITLVNLACSGRSNVGLLPGHFYLFVGDSSSGKTWLTMTILAEAIRNPLYKDYRLIHDNPERGALMDIKRYFGKSLADKIEPPGKSGSSKTLEGFYDHVSDAVRANSSFIYILDSEDALSSESEQKNTKTNRSIRRKENGEDTKGSYGDGKAKVNSSGLRQAHNSLEDTGSILIIIKQTRDNIGFDAKFNPKTRSGGRALTFYACMEIWFSVQGKIRRTARGKPRVIGTELKIHVKKNRIAGRDRTVVIPFFPSTGMDEVGSMISFLIEENHWKGSEASVEAPEFEHKGSIEKLIKMIEEEEKEAELRRLVVDVWGEIEDSCSVTRKRRYS